MYEVKLEKFEGPMNLLLELIEEQKLDISEVSIAKVADDYLEFVRDTENISLENLAEFVSIASKIILIKSRNILPSLEVTPEEEKEIKDLEQQLRAYRKFKSASENIRQILARHLVMRSRDYLLGVSTVFLPPKDLKAVELKRHYLKLIDNIALPEKMPEEAVRSVITLEEKIEELKISLQKRVETSFRELSSSAKNKLELIVSFLAMLEMVKQKIINVEQSELFEEIKITNPKFQALIPE